MQDGQTLIIEINMQQTNKIPASGAMPRPLNHEDGYAQLAANLLPWNRNPITITFKTDEFTSICPTTGQPDFSEIEIKYCPKEWYIESKAMKFYLWAFREHGAHCEKLADMIATEIRDATSCTWVQVTVSQKPRGGLSVQAVSRLMKKPSEKKT